MERHMQPTVILISLDGFRYDYFELTETPALDSLIKGGIKAEGLIPVFPSKTFPNHYSQVTGLYPEHHGLIANRMYDTTTQEWFRIGTGSTSVAESRWYQGEPIWVTAELQGKIAATYFWPGSEASIKDTKASYWKVYEHNKPYEDRVNEVLDWLDLPDTERPQFISLYFDAVDGAGHSKGPGSDAVKEAIQRVDKHIGDLLEGLQTRAILDQVHIIVVSDHGMAQLSRDRIIYLDDYIELQTVNVVDYSPIAVMYPHDSKQLEATYLALKDKHPHLHVYKKEEVPAVFHYNEHPLIPPIVCIADPGWSVSNHSYVTGNPFAFTGGTHGYDHRDSSMYGIFIAKGPKLRQGLQVAAFQNVHIYELMCRILELKPAENDGDAAVTEGFMR